VKDKKYITINKWNRESIGVLITSIVLMCLGIFNIVTGEFLLELDAPFIMSFGNGLTGFILILIGVAIFFYADSLMDEHKVEVH